MSTPTIPVGLPVLGADGQRLGQIDGVYTDPDTGRPEWASVVTDTKDSQVCFIPLAEAFPEGDCLVVPYLQSQLTKAPSPRPGAELSLSDQEQLSRYYGVAGPPSGDAPGPSTRGVMIRSEEQLRVGVERRESGRVRLRKYVVTEEVTRTFPVSHEEVRIEREPTSGADWAPDRPGEALVEADYEVILHEERLVVGLETVAVERVRLVKEVVTEDQHITEGLRKEQIAYEATEPT